MQASHPKIAFVMSTNYAGSTVLGLVLGSHPSAAFLGEPALALRKTSDGGWRHKSFCSTCKGTDRTCPIWSQEAIDRVRERPGDVYRLAEELLPGSQRLLVDASKDVQWLKARSEHVDEPYVIHISKSVESFVASATNRGAGNRWMEFTAIHWARRNREIRRLAARRQLPYLHVSYADFAGRFDSTLARLDSFLGLEPHEAQREFWAQEHHYVKGNPGVASHFDASKADSEPGPNQALYKENHQRIFVDEKWRELLSPGQVDRLYAVAEVAEESAVLGYGHPLRDGRVPAGRHLVGRMVVPALGFARKAVGRALHEARAARRASAAEG